MLCHGVVAIKVHKVKAHVDPESTTQDPAHTTGNECADKWAKQGAHESLHGRTDRPGHAGCTPGNCLCSVAAKVATIREIDNITWFILRRVAAVASMLPAQQALPPAEPPPPKPAPLDEAIELLGHRVCYGANLASHYADGHPLATAASGKKGGGIFTCTNCGFTWTRGRRLALVAMGPCPGTYVWKINMPAYLDLPWRYPRAAALMWRGHEIHPTHNLTFYRGCIFCLVCGARSATGAPRTLCLPCPLKPQSVKT